MEKPSDNNKIDIEDTYFLYAYKKDYNKLLQSYENLQDFFMKCTTSVSQIILPFVGRFIKNEEFTPLFTQRPIFKLSKVLKDIIQIHADNIDETLKQGAIYDGIGKINSSLSYIDKNVQKVLNIKIKPLVERFEQIKLKNIDIHLKRKGLKDYIIPNLTKDDLTEDMKKVKELEEKFLDIDENIINEMDIKYEPEPIFNNLKASIKQYITFLKEQWENSLKKIAELENSLDKIAFNNENKEEFYKVLKEYEVKTIKDLNSQEKKKLIIKKVLDEYKYEIKISPQVEVEELKENQKNKVKSNFLLEGKDIDDIYETLFIKDNFKKIYNKKVEAKVETIELTRKMFSENIDENRLYELLKDNNNLNYFISFLNNNRSKSIINKYSFDIILGILNKILDNLNDFPEDLVPNISRFVILLSQTYYYLDDKKEKQYLSEEIKKNKAVKEEKFWAKIANMDIQELKEKGRDLSINVTATIVTCVGIMVQFGISKEKILNFIKPFTSKYKLDEKLIETTINQK